MVIVGDDGVVAILAADLDVLQPLGNDELLLVDATLHVDHFLIVHEGAAYLDGLANGKELARAVGSYDDGVGVVIVLRPCGASE